MMAITVQQPWAWAIVHGGKNIENRTRRGVWAPAIGQRVAIHAGRTVSDAGMADQRIGQALRDRGHIHHADAPAGLNHLLGAQLHRGAIIGTVFVLDVHPAEDCCDPWGDEQRGRGESRDPVVHLELTAPRPCPPIPARGALGLWRVPAEVELELTEAVRR